MSGVMVAIDERAVADFCRRHGIARLSLFGSALRDDFGPESDVDILVEFEPGRTPGLAFFGMQDELSAIVGRRVDLNTPECLSPCFRDQVLAQARPLSRTAADTVSWGERSASLRRSAS